VLSGSLAGEIQVRLASSAVAHAVADLPYGAAAVVRLQVLITVDAAFTAEGLLCRFLFVETTPISAVHRSDGYRPGCTRIRGNIAVEAIRGPGGPRVSV
jgi:hypothetical protein